MTSYGSDYQDQDEQFDVEALLRRAIEMVDMGKSMPLSNSVILPRDDIREVLHACIDNLPLEIRQANWMLRERAEFLSKMEREGDEILRTATERAERMVQRSELVREAQRTAQKTIEHANDEARRLQHEAEDYVDQTLAEFEITLEKTYRTVQGGREKLRGPALTPVEQGGPVVDLDADLFDQEQERRSRR